MIQESLHQMDIMSLVIYKSAIALSKRMTANGIFYTYLISYIFDDVVCLLASQRLIAGRAFSENILSAICIDNKFKALIGNNQNESFPITTHSMFLNMLLSYTIQ